MLSKQEFLYLMLVNKNYEETLAQALTMEYGDGNSDLRDDVDRLMFLSAIASGKAELYLDREIKSGRRESYESILSAYRDGVALDCVSKEDSEILKENYHLLAFAAGIEAANRFAEVFSADISACFSVKAWYYYHNHLDMELSELDRVNVPLSLIQGYLYLCKSLLRVQRHSECLAVLEEMLEKGRDDEQSFHLLYVLARKGRGDISSKARELYDRFFPVYNEKIDAADLRLTGYARFTMDNSAPAGDVISVS
jgi:hypothetical protein